MPSGQKTPPNHNSFLSGELRHARKRLVRRLRPLTLVGHPQGARDRTAPNLKRQTSWKTFIKAHWDVLAAIDVTTVAVWTKGGLVTYHLLIVMEVATRRAHFAACTPTLGDEFMRQIARSLTDPFDGFLHGKKYVLVVGQTEGEIHCREQLGGMLNHYYRKAA